jgi:hypothetical protein
MTILKVDAGSSNRKQAGIGHIRVINGDLFAIRSELFLSND